MMRHFFRKLGRLKTVILITAVSVIFSVSFTILGCFLIGEDEKLLLFATISFIIPLIVAPITSWPVMGVLVKVDDLEMEMRNLATYDFLTGLLSRQAFFHDATNYINLAEREQTGFSIMAIDLDKFKTINDKYGHPAGDEVLRQFAANAQTILRKTDLIGRMGGEEFAIILPNTTQGMAFDLSQRLHSVINDSTTEYEESLIKYTVSIGLVSSSATKTETIEDILKHADQALYLAKENGRNRTVIFNADATLPLTENTPS